DRGLHPRVAGELAGVQIDAEHVADLERRQEIAAGAEATARRLGHGPELKGPSVAVDGAAAGARFTGAIAAIGGCVANAMPAAVAVSIAPVGKAEAAALGKEPPVVVRGVGSAI